MEAVVGEVAVVELPVGVASGLEVVVSAGVEEDVPEVPE